MNYQTTLNSDMLHFLQDNACDGERYSKLEAFVYLLDSVAEQFRRGCAQRSARHHYLRTRRGLELASHQCASVLDIVGKSRYPLYGSPRQVKLPLPLPLPLANTSLQCACSMTRNASGFASSWAWLLLIAALGYSAEAWTPSRQSSKVLTTRLPLVLDCEVWLAIYCSTAPTRFRMTTRSMKRFAVCSWMIVSSTSLSF